MGTAGRPGINWRAQHASFVLSEAELLKRFMCPCCGEGEQGRGQKHLTEGSCVYNSRQQGGHTQHPAVELCVNQPAAALRGEEAASCGGAVYAPPGPAAGTARISTSESAGALEAEEEERGGAGEGRRDALKDGRRRYKPWWQSRDL
ncbi:hypothetical protein NDU88_002993 [Pleurodeles waltl]|uniref:Uncharacterized protein n=1 Tax=Pleurodeles waltl TaxID=8319 RepID=A0AAV7M5T9_PLEWA|nr:hypothetical protein NDU88_002993 [Pleurodeles waltl]